MRAAIMVAVLVALSTGADANTPEDKKAAVRQHFTDGTKHYNLGEYHAALEDFREGYRLSGDSAFLYNLGQCQRALGERREAVISYRAYLRELPGAPNAAAVEQRIVELEKAIKDAEAQAPPQGTQPPQTTRTTDLRTVPTAEETPAPMKPAPAKPKRTVLVAALVVGAVLVVGAGVGIGVGVGFTSGGATTIPASGLGNMSIRFP